MAEDMIDLGVNVPATMAVAIATIASHGGRTKADVVREALQGVIDREIAQAHASIELLADLERNGIGSGSVPPSSRKRAEK